MIVFSILIPYLLASFVLADDELIPLRQTLSPINKFVYF